MKTVFLAPLIFCNICALADIKICTLNPTVIGGSILSTNAYVISGEKDCLSMRSVSVSLFKGTTEITSLIADYSASLKIEDLIKTYTLLLETPPITRFAAGNLYVWKLKDTDKYPRLEVVVTMVEEYGSEHVQVQMSRRAETRGKGNSKLSPP